MVMKGAAAGAMLSVIMGMLVVSVLLGSLLPEIANPTLGVVSNDTVASNLTGATAPLVSLVPLIVVVAVLVGILAAIGFKVSG